MYESFDFTNDRLDIKLNAFKDKEGEIWFIGKEVAELFGYKNTKKAIIDHVDEEEKVKLKNEEIKKLFEGNKTLLTNYTNYTKIRELTLINESGFYCLAVKSKLPNAIKYRKWITKEVLPSLRKNNYYIDEQNVDNKQIEELKERIDKLEKYRAEMEKYADELEEENKTMEDDYNPNNYYTIREAKEAFGWDIDFSTELLRKVSAELNKKAIPVKGYYYGKPTTYNRYHYLVWWKCYPFTKPQEAREDEI